MDVKQVGKIVVNIAICMLLILPLDVIIFDLNVRQ